MLIRHCEEILAKKSHTGASITKTYHWFFCDIVSSALPSKTTTEQIKKITKFYDILSKTRIMQNSDPNRIIVPTGDGYVVGFSDSSEKPIRLAKNLLQKVEKYNKTKRGKDKLFLRIGIDSGPVYEIKDKITNKKAFWGPGIIMAKRVMDLGKENHILVSEKLAEDLRKLTNEYKSEFRSIGKYEIKHGEKIEIYNVYGKDFGNRIFPREGKEIKKKESDKDLRSPSNFEFRKIDIVLDVTNPKTMMLHHTWIWDIVNVSRESLPQLVYQIGGDRPREFNDLNVRATDGNGNNLKIVSIDENKPTYKEFHVKFKHPIKSRQLVKNLKLEYDWEEPDRKFSFKLPTNCKKLSYKFSITKGEEKRLRILKRIGLGGWNRVEKPPFVTKFLKKTTSLSWEGQNLKAYDEYGIQW